MLLSSPAIVFASLIGGLAAKPLGLVLPAAQEDCGLAARSTNSSGPCVTSPQGSGNLSVNSGGPSISAGDYINLVRTGYDQLRDHYKIQSTDYGLTSVNVGFESPDSNSFRMETRSSSAILGAQWLPRPRCWGFYQSENLYRNHEFAKERALTAVSPLTAFTVAQAWAQDKPGASLGSWMKLRNYASNCPAAGKQLTWQILVYGYSPIQALYVGATDGRPYEDKPLNTLSDSHLSGNFTAKL